MHSLLEAPDQVANFLVLLIVKRSSAGKLEASAHAFAHGLEPMRVPLTMPQQNDAITEVTASPRLSLRKTCYACGKWLLSTVKASGFAKTTNLLTEKQRSIHCKPTARIVAINIRTWPGIPAADAQVSVLDVGSCPLP